MSHQRNIRFPLGLQTTLKYDIFSNKFAVSRVIGGIKVTVNVTERDLREIGDGDINDLILSAKHAPSIEHTLAPAHTRVVGRRGRLAGYAL